jgi:hypothetical protein
MQAALTLQKILNMLSPMLEGKRVKLVRHKDTRPGELGKFRQILKDRKALLEGQKNQGGDNFKGCEYIVSFVGLKHNRSLLFGVFKVNGSKKGARTDGRPGYFYDLEQVAEFNSLVGRLIIDWGGAARSWFQWYHKRPKEVIEILPQGYIGNFPGLLDFVLEFKELKELIEYPDANRDWYHHLSSVNGVYLILDDKRGKQYIGSACGDQGIWGRWKNYAATHHGGNKELKALLEKDPEYARNFRFSVLQALPSNTTAPETIEVEKLYKKKLGSLAHGLNAN